jgi:membrane protein implicated in regulation of membrane protease activity
MQSIYFGAIAFGATLLVVSLVIGGKDHDHGGHSHPGDAGGFAWAPFGSLRFWIFLFAFGGGAGYALGQLGSGTVASAVGALAIGWVAGVLAVMVVRTMAKNSVSSEVGARELVGQTGTLVLPVGPGKPGKVRVDVKGRAEDFVANTVDEVGEMPTGATVLIIAEGDRGSLLVSKHDV